MGLYRAGMHTTAELAELCSVGRSTVYRAVQRTGEPAVANARRSPRRIGAGASTVTGTPAQATVLVVRVLQQSASGRSPARRRINSSGPAALAAACWCRVGRERGRSARTRHRHPRPAKKDRMSQHPDDLDRPPSSYDPDEPLIVTYADVIAARNAVGALLMIVKDRVDPLSQFRQTNIKDDLQRE